MNRTRMMNDAKFLSAIALSLLLAACSTEGGLLDAPQEGDCPIGFSTIIEEAAETRGSLTTTNLRSMSVFAYYTEGSNWNTSHKPNFMFNQKVTRTGSTAPWTYSPVKYWPNNPNDKLSFFAFAPALASVSGLSLAGTATTASYPVLKYTVPTTVASQTDLLAATPLMNRTQSATALSFQMKHVMTRILVKAKCTEAITMNSVQLNGARGTGNLTLNANPSWSGIGSTLINFKHSAATSVSANTATQVAEFFMLPSTGKSITINFTYSGTTETKTVSLPSTAWTQGTSIAYTLNIEVGSEVTLTVKSWDTNTSNGNMGQEVPSGTQYPYIMNGVLYETATKSYYLGEIKENWWSWDNTMNHCKNIYSAGPFPAREWRLPNKAELSKIVETKDVITDKYPIWTTSYWTSEENGTNEAWYGYGRPVTFATRTKGDGVVMLCIRDMGEITVYPTYRIKDGYEIVYINANTTLGFNRGNGSYLRYQNAVNRCTALRDGGYSDWRLPTKSELELLRGIGELRSGVIWTGTPSSTGNVWVYHNGNSAFQQYSTTEAWADAITPCVRSY